MWARKIMNQVIRGVNRLVVGNDIALVDLLFLVVIGEDGAVGRELLGVTLLDCGAGVDTSVGDGSGVGSWRNSSVGIGGRGNTSVGVGSGSDSSVGICSWGDASVGVGSRSNTGVGIGGGCG